MGIILLCRPLIASMYDLSDTAMAYTMTMMLILAFYTPLQSFNTTAIIGVMRGGGDSKFGMYLDAITLWGVALVLGSLGAFVFHLSVPMVYFLLISDELAKILFRHPAGAQRQVANERHPRARRAGRVAPR